MHIESRKPRRVAFWYKPCNMRTSNRNSTSSKPPMLISCSPRFQTYVPIAGSSSLCSSAPWTPFPANQNGNSSASVDFGHFVSNSWPSMTPMVFRLMPSPKSHGGQGTRS